MSLPNSEPSVASRRRTALAWLSSLVLLLLVAPVGTWLWLIAGANPNSSPSPRPLPPGQFQAEARTFVAAIRYLMTPETDPLPVPAAPLTYSNLLAFQSSAPSFSGFPSNMAEFPTGPATNRPGRI